jgi:hypothetical protein
VCSSDLFEVSAGGGEVDSKPRGSGSDCGFGWADLESDLREKFFKNSSGVSGGGSK